MVEHKEVKEEIYEDYNPATDYNTHQEEHIEYIYHPDGGRTEKRTVKKTQYDLAGSEHPTQASHPRQNYGMQNGNNYQNAPNQQYGYP